MRDEKQHKLNEVSHRSVTVREEFGTLDLKTAAMAVASYS